MKINPKCKISSNEMKNISKEIIEHCLDDVMFVFKLRQNDIIYKTGTLNKLIEIQDLNKPNRSALF